MSNALSVLTCALEAHIDIYGAEDFLGPDPSADSVPRRPPVMPSAQTDSVSSTPAGDGAPDLSRVAAMEAPGSAEQGPVGTETEDPLTARPGPERIGALIPASSPLHDFSTLQQVAEWVSRTVLIELDETRLNPVFGVGSPEADLMVIGEAPGADEDQQGEPFVGRAGQLLTKILEATGFAREEVYIANILKSRPPGNRDPKPEEVAAHIPILYKQISLVRPKLLLCVGKTAGNSLLGVQDSLKSLRGRFHDFHGIPTVITYHPAALLRNPQWKRPTWEDMKMLRTRFDELTPGT